MGRCLFARLSVHISRHVYSELHYTRRLDGPLVYRLEKCRNLERTHSGLRLTTAHALFHVAQHLFGSWHDVRPAALRSAHARSSTSRRPLQHGTHCRQRTFDIRATKSTELATMSTAIDKLSNSRSCRFVTKTGNKVDHIGNSHLCHRFVAGFGNSRLCRQCVLGFRRLKAEKVLLLSRRTTHLQSRKRRRFLTRIADFLG